MKIPFLKYIIFCLLPGMQIACTKNFLDIKSDASIKVPETLADFQGMLDNTSVMTSGALYTHEIASDGHYVLDSWYNTRIKDKTTDAYIWSKTVRHSSVTDWNAPYTRVLYLNIILDGLDRYKSELSKEIEYKNIKGQALFQRARTFYEFAQLYSIPYNTNTFDQPYGIVLRMTSDITKPSVRSTVKETYRIIIDDLMEAKDLLPEKSAAPSRASKQAVLAQLARVYHSMREYDKALIYADEALKIDSALLNFNDLSATASFIGLYNKEVIFHVSYSSPYLTTNCLIERSLFDLYDNNDLRKSRCFKQNVDNTISFKGNYESSTSIIFCGLATDELYLIRAECLARANKVTEAMSDVNTLLKSRWNKDAVYSDLTAANALDAIRIILRERQKELLLRGTRWSDLRRLNQEPGYETTLKRTVSGTEYILEPNSYKYTFPIPDDIIEQTGIQQNPKWPVASDL